MATLLTTTTDEVSAEFSPGGEFNIQCDAADPHVVIDVYARLDAAAAAVIIDSFVPALKPVVRYVEFPLVKLGVRGNKAGNTINLWVD